MDTESIISVPNTIVHYECEKDGKKESVTLNPNGFDFKIVLREKGRKKSDRMKITFKLNQDETKAWQMFSKVFKPQEGISEEEFVKAVFLMGASSIEERAIESVKAHKMKEAEEVAKLAEPVVSVEDKSTD